MAAVSSILYKVTSITEFSENIILVKAKVTSNTSQGSAISGLQAEYDLVRIPEIQWLHTESGYGLRTGLWPTAVFTHAPLAVSGWIFSVSNGLRLT